MQQSSHCTCTSSALPPPPQRWVEKDCAAAAGRVDLWFSSWRHNGVYLDCTMEEGKGEGDGSVVDEPHLHACHCVE